jgi:xanthine dehydrogenase large subunit
VGEPPFVLGLSVWAAAKQAIAGIAENPARSPALNLPATSEEILRHLSRRDEAPSAARPAATTAPRFDEDRETETHARAEI